MLLMVEKIIRGGICHSVYRHTKANNKYMENYNKNNDLQDLQYLDLNNLYGWAMSQKLPVNNFEWMKETRFDTSSYELDRPLPKGKSGKVIELMKDELSGKIITKFVGLTAKTYSYLIDDGSEDNKAKGTKGVS